MLTCYLVCMFFLFVCFFYSTACSFLQKHVHKAFGGNKSNIRIKVTYVVRLNLRPSIPHYSKLRPMLNVTFSTRRAGNCCINLRALHWLLVHTMCADDFLKLSKSEVNTAYNAVLRLRGQCRDWTIQYRVMFQVHLLLLKIRYIFLKISSYFIPLS